MEIIEIKLNYWLDIQRGLYDSNKNNLAKRIIMKELKLKLVALKEKEKQLKAKINNSFSTEEEFNSFVEENKEMLIDLKRIKVEIKKIEWELMTDEEKEVHLKYLNDLQDKFKDEQ